MQKIIVELSDERLITASGLSLVGMLLGRSKFVTTCLPLTIPHKFSDTPVV